MTGIEGQDCNKCFWGAEVRHRYYEKGALVRTEYKHECTQGGRPKPCQRGLFMEK